MTSLSDKDRIQTFCMEAADLLAKRGDIPANYRGLSPFNDPSRNEPFQALASFRPAAHAIGGLPDFAERFGSPNAESFALQLLYNYLGTCEAPDFDIERFDAAWQSLLDELAAPEWSYIGLCNLQNFKSDNTFLDFGDGITIRARSFAELAAVLGWSDERIEATLGRDWSEGSFGTHVLLIETKLPKTPDNLVLANDGAFFQKFSRFLLALRLLKAGFVRPGRVFYARSARFQFGLGGISSSGNSGWQPGSEYSLTAEETPTVKDIYKELAAVESRGDAARPLNLALRSFSTIYEREHFRAEDRLVDAITAIEASLRLDTDLSFRSSFQVAGLLAADDDERVRIYKEMRTFYDTRSKIVHGGDLKAKHMDAVTNHERLIDLVRLLVRAFVFLTAGVGVPPDFYAEVDSSLQHAGRRASLRGSLGLS